MKLPITIAAEQQVSKQLAITKYELEQIEAWANFETLKANWYHDEAKSVRCQIALVSPEYFQARFTEQETGQEAEQETSLADWQIDQTTQSAYKFPELGDKQIIFIATCQQGLNKQNFDSSQASSSQWIGSENAVKLQQLIRHWLLTLAKHYALDAID